MRRQVRNLRYIFRPKSIAIVGASGSPSKVGAVVLKNLIEGNFGGEIYPINPKYGELSGMKCYPTVNAVKKKIDCAIIATPAQVVPKILEQCGKKKIKGVVVLSGGFAEVGNAELEKKLKKTADKYGMAVIGPNCVSGDSKVLIKQNGRVKNTEIGPLCADLMGQNGDLVYSCSGTEILDMNKLPRAKQIYTLSFSRKKFSFRKVSKLFRRKKCSGVFEVSLYGGRKIVCSGDHPFLVKIKNKKEMTKLDCRQLTGNELIPCPHSISSGRGIQKMDLFGHVMKMKNDGQLTDKAAKNLRFLIDGEPHLMNGGAGFVKTRSGEFEGYKNGQYIYWKHGRVILPRYLPIDKSLCVTCGFFVADGNYHDNYMKIGYVDSVEEERVLRKCIDSVFLGFPEANSRSKEIKFGRRIGKFLFQDVFSVPAYAHKKRAPDFIFSSPPETIIHFLSGLFSGDGGVYLSKKTKKNCLYFFSTSKDLIDDVVCLLHMVGVDSYRFTKKRTKAQFKNKTYPARDLHGIRIDSLHYIKHLYDGGFRFLDPIQNKKLAEIIRQDRKKCISCKRLCEGPVSYKKIKQIKKLDRPIDLYDFEVGGSHNFVVNNILTSNCLGVLNPYQRVDSIFLPMYKLKRPRPGGISFVTQSGATGTCVVDLAAKYGVGISKFISYGNGTVINENDLLEYLEKDKKTEEILLYLEGTKDGKRLLKVMERVNRKKPIVVLKAGRGEKASKAAFSHTGNLAGNYLAYDAAFRQSKVVVANSLDELFEFVKIFNQALPKGNRIGIVTNGGGLGVLTTDVIEENKLELADFSKETEKKLKKILPDYANAKNPLDIIADADSELYKKALNIIKDSKEVDIIAVIVLFQAPAVDERILNILINLSDMKKKPVVVIAVGGEYTEGHREILESYGVPTYSSPSDAIKAVKKLVDYSSAARRVER